MVVIYFCQNKAELACTHVLILHPVMVPVVEGLMDPLCTDLVPDHRYF